MVLADLLLKSGLQIGIAHCNFNLRADESDADEDFIRAFASKNNLPIHVQKFDTEKFAQDFGLSIQVAARELRYGYFHEILDSGKYDFILTAHHADDNLETFLINLTRGTGIDGLTGIPQQNEKIIRPLLSFSREEIEAYAKTENLEWREDSSNTSDKYLRNKIRHRIVPLLKEIRPDLLAGFSKTQVFLQQTQSLAEDASVMVFGKVARRFGNETRFDVGQLKVLPHYKAYLYSWFKDFGFPVWENVYDLVDAQSGKQVFSNSHVLLKDRDFLILTALEEGTRNREFRIYKGMSELEHPIKITLKSVENVGKNSNSAIFADAEKLAFPLVLRKWKEGDAFQPAGMGGSSKKVSKFFKDEKFSLRDKENAWLLCSGDDIVWIVGHRADDRFSVRRTTTNILHIALEE